LNGHNHQFLILGFLGMAALVMVSACIS
jgi:hypothetical protein